MAPQLEPAVRGLRDAFALEVGYRDPLVAAWSVENAVLPVGTSFIEVCAPTERDSAAARFLGKRPQGGGYIVVMECDDLERRRARLEGLGVRLVTDLAIPGFRTLQLHPRDAGACMLELNHTQGADPSPDAYAPAGPHWQQAIRREVVDGLAGIEVRARAPQRLAAHWGQITETPVTQLADGTPQLAMGPLVRFTVAEDDEPEGIATIELFASDAAAVGRTTRMLGLDFRLVAR